MTDAFIARPSAEKASNTRQKGLRGASAGPAIRPRDQGVLWDSEGGDALADVERLACGVHRSVSPHRETCPRDELTKLGSLNSLLDEAVHVEPKCHLPERGERKAEEELREIERFRRVGVVPEALDHLDDVRVNRRRDDRAELGLIRVRSTLDVSESTTDLGEDLGRRLALHLPLGPVHSKYSCLERQR